MAFGSCSLKHAPSLVHDGLSSPFCLTREIHAGFNDVCHRREACCTRHVVQHGPPSSIKARCKIAPGENTSVKGRSGRYLARWAIAFYSCVWSVLAFIFTFQIPALAESLHM